MTQQKRVLLTGICRPLGERHGDGRSVGYELLHGQVTRAQGLFSPRCSGTEGALELIAENLEAPTTVLHHPSRRELIRELRRGYDIVGVSFVLATFHRMKEVVELIRKHSPDSEIVLGGYGTVLSDEELAPWGDHVCREEGVGFMRRLLGEEPLPMPYRHPLVVDRLKMFGKEVSVSGEIYGGLGCPNGCDFCCTSHFFKRRHIRLLPTGQDIYNVVKDYQEIDPDISFVILDEDFLLNKRRALEFRDCALKGERAISVFAFASVRAISQYDVSELLEMGIDGLWIGFEGTRSGYPKQSGRPIGEIFQELRQNGITVLASMIVGLPYQTPEIIEDELSELLSFEPTLCQFMIYGPTPGTPFYERVMEEGLMHQELADDREHYYRSCTGFKAMVHHPSMDPEQIEAEQERCFQQDFERLGPTLYREIETKLKGYLELADSPRPYLRKQAERYAKVLRSAYPVFLPGRFLAPNRAIRDRVVALERRVHETFGAPTRLERLSSAGAVVAAAWTALTLKLGLFQHPRLVRHTYRMPDASLPSRVWRRVCGPDPSGHSVEAELRPGSTVWVRVDGDLRPDGAERLAKRLRKALARGRERLVLDVTELASMEESAAEKLGEKLRAYRGRIRVALPLEQQFAALATLFGLYH